MHAYTTLIMVSVNRKKVLVGWYFGDSDSLTSKHSNMAHQNTNNFIHFDRLILSFPTLEKPKINIILMCYEELLLIRYLVATSTLFFYVQQCV